MSTRSHSVRLSALCLMSCLILACHPGGDGAGPEDAAAARDQALSPRPVRLVTAEVREETPVLELVGELRAMDTVIISSELAGRVDRVLVEVGDRVLAGDALVEIDQKTFTLRVEQAEAQLAAASAELALAEKELERKRDLLTDRTIAQATFDQVLATRDLASAQVNAARATRDLARHDFERSVVRASGPAVVAERKVTAGQWADVGTALFDLATGDSIKVAARVPSSWAPRLGGLEGFDFRVQGEASSRRAKLYSIDPVVQGSSRSFEAVGLSPNPDRVLRPGMFANVVLTAPESVHSLWLPTAAVVISDLPQVFFSRDGVVVPRSVQAGRRDDGAIEVVSGLGPDEKVIADATGLHRGLPVAVVGD